MQENYWSRISNQRIRRRRALTVAGGTALSATLLAACGGDDGGAGTGDGSSFVTQPLDTTKQAKRGGTLKDQSSSDSPTLDIVSPLRGGGGNAVPSKVYSTLVRQMPGHLKPSVRELGPDIAESWEWSPDRLQVTLKLRPGVKFHNKPPVNGRAFHIDDVLFSWNRYAAKGALRATVVNSVSPDAPVLSVSAADSRTLVIKLKEPVVHALALFASFGTFSGNVIMVPKETDTTWDIRADMIGTGPFIMSNYSPSIGWTLKRHPEYFDQDFAFFDQVDMPIISEYAASLAQFKSGNIHYFGVRPEDLSFVKREEPRILVYSEGLSILNTDTLSYGWLPEGKSPFLDERVRQAVSMSWDRDLWIDTFHDVSKFEAEGVPMGVRWNSHIMADSEGEWLDPKGSDFGPNAKYFRHDIPEAKKLLAAAGYPNGFNVTSHYTVSGTGAAETRHYVAAENMSDDVGIKVQVEHADYATQYIPLYRDGQGQFEGWTLASQSGSTLRLISAVSSLAASYWSKGGITFKGFSTSGRNDKAGDPQLNALIDRARLEPDTNKRQELTFDIQRYLAKAMWGLLLPGGAAAFTMAWPALSNFRVYQIAGRGVQPNAWGYYRMWLDTTRPPFTA